MSEQATAKTLYEKLWDRHVVDLKEDGTTILYIDRHLIHEVTSPQAFEGLRIHNRPLWRTNSILAVADHNVPTNNLEHGITDPVSRLQVETLDKNCADFKVNEFKMGDIRQGIVHVVGPEQGATLPGMTIVCGDSHTSTHGAFAALAFGIGTSEVEHVFATQCLVTKKSKTMLIHLNGKAQAGVSSKDVILYVIGQIGTAGGTGYAIEFGGDYISTLSMDARMSMCNMAIEGGARSGIIGVDQITIDYLKGKPFAPNANQWDQAVAYWNTLKSDDGASFDKIIDIDVASIVPQVTWGTSPEMVVSINDVVPNPANESDAVKSEGMKRALAYMGLEAGTPIKAIPVDKVFIGSCTNSRLEDLRIASEVVKGKKIASNIKLALVVPGSGLVKQQAEAEGLDKIFIDAGFEWRSPGCSMCLAMNADRLEPNERCASTSNRNFEGRQGMGGRTHLVSPRVAAATAINGTFADTI